MPLSVYHALTATTPDNTNFEIRPLAHWNASHVLTANLTGSEIINAFSNANGFSFGTSGGAVTGSYTVPQTSVFSNSNGLTFGTAGSTVTGSYTVPSVTNLTRLFVPEAPFLTPVSAPGNATASFRYVAPQASISGTRIDLLMGHSGGSAATTATCAIAFSAYAVIYTRNAASLSSLSSGSTQTTYSYASNSAGNTEFTQSNIIPISVPVNFNMPPGEYMVGFNFITATSSVGLSTTNLGQTWSVMGGNNLQTALVYAEIGSGSNASVNLQSGMGVYSAATTGLSGSYPLSAIVMTGASLSQANVALVFRNA
jgi:hypothetical protein